MKKIKSILLMSALAAGTVCSDAETSYMFDNPDNKTFFGVRVGVDISSAANGGGNYSSNAGFSAGAIYNIPLFMNLYFEPGLSFFYNAFGTSKWNSFIPDNPIYDPETGEPVSVLYQVDGSIRNFGFRVPLMIGYHFDFAEDVKVNVFTGPQLNMSLYANYKVGAAYGNDKDMIDRDGSLFGTDGFKHLDLQWKFGVGVAYQTYYAGLSGAWGLTDMKSGTAMLPRDLRRNLFSITLGYNF